MKWHFIIAIVTIIFTISFGTLNCMSWSGGGEDEKEISAEDDDDTNDGADDDADDDTDDDTDDDCEGCLFEDECHEQGDLNPGNPCWICTANGWADNDDGASCDDEDFCNGVDTCLGGACDLHEYVDGDERCPDDGFYCNGEEYCAEEDERCTSRDVPDCPDDGLWCNGDESCDEVNDECAHSGDPCPDNSVFCDGTESCNDWTNSCYSSGNPCPDNGVFCDGTETCSEGTNSCDHSGDPCSDDGVYCNGIEECNEQTDMCDSSGDPCQDDGQWCNGERYCKEDDDSCAVRNIPDCSDNGLFCDGDESCNDETDECVSSGDPCDDNGLYCDGDESCDEAADQCESSGDPCVDNGLYCDGDESCDETADQCVSSGDPCADGVDCTNDNCYEGGSEEEDIVGFTTSNYTGANRTRGNFFQCATGTTLTGVRMYLYLSSDSSVTAAIYEGNSISGSLSLIDSKTVVLTANGTGWYTIDGLNTPMEAGQYYGIVFTWDSPSIVYYNGTTGNETVSFGVRVGPIVLSGFLPSSLTGSTSSIGYRQAVITEILGVGNCVHEPSDAYCDDGAFCNGAEFCDAIDDCQPGAPVDCPDNGLFCDGDESCDEATDECTHSGDPCENPPFCDENLDACTTWDPGDEEVFVSEGNFQMGCEPEDGGCDADESPRHEVWLSAYYIDTYEVTNASYADFLTWHGNDCGGYECVDADATYYLRLSESGGVWSADVGYEDHPLVEVSWYGGTAYCEAQGKRLPTEAQWEKAAKGAAEHYIYPWGESLIANAANYRDSGDPFDNGTTPVGYYDGSDHGGAYQTTDGRSPYGAHDMAGNVFEWGSDWYLSDYYDEYSPDAWPADPQGPDTGTSRVLRGGGCGNPDGNLRASNRNGFDPDSPYGSIGFRCSRDYTSTTTTTTTTTSTTTTTTWESGDDEVFVPEGSFQMGCEPEDTQCQSGESPRHEVWLSAYYIDTYEVTNTTYAEFLTWHGNDCEGYECVDADSIYIRISESGGVWSADADFEDHPQVVVSWFGAKAYCESQGKRLPTEAQWEKAAKGAVEHYIYPWGESSIANAANYEDSGDPFDNGTTPVGYYDGSDHGGAYQTVDGRSPYGAHDMAGNVCEWVNDWKDDNYYDGYSPDAWPNDPQGPDDGTSRVLRGGRWWASGPRGLRSSDRNGNNPSSHISVYGFRCSRD
jgi:formylglycine-generating enzyme required for sulfatase activity